MNYLVFAIVFLFAATAERFLIFILKRARAHQTLKNYGPERHVLTKQGTPTMGGLVFPFAFFFGLFLGHYACRIDVYLVFPVAIYPLLTSTVGLVDDYLKFSKKSSEGLSSLHKLFLQLVVTIPWALWVLSRDSLFIWPGMPVRPMIAFPILVFFAVGAQNAVNITDGLDGLASGAFLISMAFASIVLPSPWSFLAFITLATMFSFLLFNIYPAKVFMGDVGAHFLGGVLISLVVGSRMLILIFPLGFIFGIEILSVTIQIIAIHVFSKKVFLMSPIHHHFELLGWKEQKIVYVFWFVHVLGMISLWIMPSVMMTH
ncbi:MAG: phospho-N-acetylmuramoyl-pentapeptide-transferase [Synergistaceae bacterium]|nr:phospho-N-acetylmuramoyl-pentapeptide-transferase [Synergistaceae bacterium]